MERHEHRPPEIHCRNCGAELDMRRVIRRRMGGLFGWGRWRTEVVCLKCGEKNRFGREVAVYVARHPPRNPILRVLFQLRYRRRNPRAMADLRRHHPWIGEDGITTDLAKLVSAASFPVYGLKGRPLGLRFMGTGAAGGGRPSALERIDLNYGVGHPRQLEQALRIDQGPRASEMNILANFVSNRAPKEWRDEYFYLGNFHRDWNQERLQQAPRWKTTIQISGEDVEVELASWEEPFQLLLARFSLGESPLLAASMNMSQQMLLEALRTLALLKEDQAAIDAYQGDMKEVRREQQEYHDKYLT